MHQRTLTVSPVFFALFYFPCDGGFSAHIDVQLDLRLDERDALVMKDKVASELCVDVAIVNVTNFAILIAEEIP